MLTIFRHLLLFSTLLIQNQVLVNSNTKEDESEGGWSWDRILNRQGDPIVANGNVWPPPKDESANDCLILVTRNQFMWHCPEGDDSSYERTILYRKNGRYRGAFTAPGTERRRLWLLDSPEDHDRLLELDTVTGNILQSLVIPGTVDAHDAVRLKDSVFIVDTRNGNVVELALPASAPPFTESSIQAGAKPVEKEEYATVIKVHTGFTRGDHINNVAVHSELLISNLHGGSRSLSPTRLSALSRSIPSEDGRELNLEQDGFSVVDNVGTMCHGIAFWEDTAKSQIKLISLDSKHGTLVSVVLVGPNKGEREVLWVPDYEKHPVLIAPDGITKAYRRGGTHSFSKGLAVQGGVAYFGVSYARAPPLRQTVPESLLVAVDLATRQELWTRTVRSNGLINQVLTQSHLGWQVQLPAERSTVELTYHGSGGRLVRTCNDLVEEGGDVCKAFEENPQLCNAAASQETSQYCCACKGGEVKQVPLLAGTLDREIMKINEEVTATATFAQTSQCLDSQGLTKRLPLSEKTDHRVEMISDLDKDLGFIVTHLCHLNVEPLQKRILELGSDAAFDDAVQLKKGNSLVTGRKRVLDRFKPGCTSIQFIFSSKATDVVYHFPWFDEWLPMLQESVLQPLGIPVNAILRMMLANMPNGSSINFHRDKNAWVKRAHRVHVPIITHPNIFFLTKIEDSGEILRIKSGMGEVYEFNNAMPHAVRNTGGTRVHLIIDWIEDATTEQGDLGYTLVKVPPGQQCDQNSNLLDCHPATMDIEADDKYAGDVYESETTVDTKTEL